MVWFSWSSTIWAWIRPSVSHRPHTFPGLNPWAHILIPLSWRILSLSLLPLHPKEEWTVCTVLHGIVIGLWPTLFLPGNSGCGVGALKVLAWNKRENILSKVWSGLFLGGVSSCHVTVKIKKLIYGVLYKFAMCHVKKTLWIYFLLFLLSNMPHRCPGCHSRCSWIFAEGGAGVYVWNCCMLLVWLTMFIAPDPLLVLGVRVGLGHNHAHADFLSFIVL